MVPEPPPKSPVAAGSQVPVADAGNMAGVIRLANREKDVAKTKPLRRSENMH
jgi:hypothetical protein